MQRRALVIDHEPGTCELIQKTLSSSGMDALVVSSPNDAINLLEEGKFDIVFLEFHASTKAIDLVHQIRESQRFRAITLVLLGADRNPSSLGRGFDAGASFFLYKPLDKTSVLRLVHAAQGKIEHERRRTRRVPVQSKVRLRTSREELQGETVDVSMIGMLVRAPSILPVGSVVNVSLYASSRGRPILGAGSVVRIAPGNRMGIALDRLTISESERLQEFLLPLIQAEVSQRS
ncbi:MAG TPA: response regulator [Candidatus Acidoferrales bacterium]|nr:response regulator [Candidatus Acidoferrales bacterium]